MAQRSSVGKVPYMAVLASVAWLAACNPTPDYRIELRNIPADAAMIMFGWKSESDVSSRTSLVVPIADLSAETRQHTSINLGLLDSPESTGVLSIALADPNGCIFAVTSTDNVQRSSGATVSMLDVDLDATNNSRVVRRNRVPNPPLACPPNPQQPPYPAQVACQKLPGLIGIPAEPTLVDTRPVVIASIRQYKGPARVFDEGGISVYGWGFDRPSATFGATCDPTQCFNKLFQDYPGFAPLILTAPLSYRYPQLRVVGYGQIDLPFSEIKAALSTASAGFQNAVLLCLSVSAISFTVTNPDGKQTSYAEPLVEM